MRDLKTNPITLACTCITSLALGMTALASTSNLDTGACCLEDPDTGQLVCQIVTEHVCTDYNGYYYGDNTSCSDPFVECDAPAQDGACCVPQADGTLLCLILSADQCDAQNGYYYGNGTLCSDPFVECDPPPIEGACCFDKDGVMTCVVITDQKCLELSGTWYGSGTLCTDPQVDCIQFNLDGACCYEEPDTGQLVCNEMIQEWCIDIGGTWYGPGTLCTDPQVDCVHQNEDGACCFEENGVLYCLHMIEEFCIDLNGTWYGPGTNCSDPTIECETPPIEECELHEPSNCAGRPHYSDPNFSDVFLGGRVAIETSSPSILGGQVVKVFDLTNINSAPNDTWFAMNRYSDSDWSPQNLGSIFGLAVDGDGNIFVTATRSWNADVPAFGGWGAVYRLDHITGDITLFATLPNTDASLGNIAYDCDHDQFFVSNIEDGIIYRLDANGNILDSFDHGTPWSGSAGAAPLGDRVWAVEVHGGRLYYSLWNEDRLNKSATEANEIWSVELDALGQPIGSERLEVIIPGYSSWNGPEYSSPVSDIRFTVEGSMLVAERSMNGWDDVTAHDARALEFECIDGAWTCDVNRFNVGDVTYFNPGRNSAGGIDATRELVFASGDALHLGGIGDNIYGFQALPMPGGDTTTSKLVDYQDNLDAQDKTLLGDLVVTDVDYCVPVGLNYVDCMVDGGSAYHEMVFYMSHTGAGNISALEITTPSGLTVSQDYFSGPFAPMSSYQFTTDVFGATGGGVYCFEVTVYYQHGNASCTSLLCIEFPECNDPCPGDVNGDMVIDITDLLIVLSQWGQTCSGCPADVTGDGVINIADLLAIIANWGTPCG